MAKRNTPAVEAKEVVEVVEEVTPAVEVTVVYQLGTRTYSKKVHGDDFEDLAKQFVAKHGGEIV